MPALKHNITIEQGADDTLEVTWEDDDGEPIDLTGYTARMQVRRTHDNATKLLDLVSPTNITLGGVLGTVTVAWTSAATAALPAPVKAVYDLEVIDSGGVVTRLLEGIANITPEVTR